MLPQKYRSILEQISAQERLISENPYLLETEYILSHSEKLKKLKEEVLGVANELRKNRSTLNISKSRV